MSPKFKAGDGIFCKNYPDHCHKIVEVVASIVPNSSNYVMEDSTVYSAGYIDHAYENFAIIGTSLYKALSEEK